MARNKHVTGPVNPILARCNIGELPSQGSVSDPMMRLYHYLRSWRGQGQIFNFSGVGPQGQDDSETAFPQKNPPIDYETNTDPCYEVILDNVTKVDTSNVTRQLYGIIIPWQVAPHRDRCLGVTTVPATVTWEADRGDYTIEQTIYHTTSPSSNWVPAIPLDDNRSDGANAYNKCTVPEIHLYNSEVNTDCNDLNCNASHTFAWGVGNDATLTKVSSTPTPYSGSRCLKIAYNGTANPYAWPKRPHAPKAYKAGVSPFKVGRKYTVECRYITDGTSSFLLKCGATTYVTGNPSTWTKTTATFVAANDLIHFECSGTGWVAIDSVVIKEHGTFDYEPGGSGAYTVGKLRTNRIRVASLAIWAAPDKTLTDDEAEVLPYHVQQGRAIRGYDASGDKSLGSIIHKIGDGSNSDHLERVTRRCLFSWGHPCGVGTTSSTERVIQGDQDSWFLIKTSNLFNLASGTDVQFAQPVIVAYASGASGGDPAYVRVKFYNGGSTNTVTFTITDSGGLDTGSSVGMANNYGNGYEKVQVTLQAPSSGYVYLKSLSIYELAPQPV